MTQLIASSGCLPSDNLFNTGSRNAAVLPVPVCATAVSYTHLDVYKRQGL